MKFRKLFPVRILVLLLITAVLAGPSVIPAAAQELTFTPVADAYVNAKHPSTNYGSTHKMKLNASPSMAGYLRFKVSGAAANPIRVQLMVFIKSASSQDLVFRSVDDHSWGEATINFLNAPPMGDNLAVSPAGKSRTWVAFDVTSYVSGNGTFDFGITTTGAAIAKIAARESGAKAPRLVFDYGGSFNGSIQHVFEVILENHSYSQVWNSSSSPYITSLGRAYARATNYKAITHPSLPNYLDLFGGSNYGITTDCDPAASCHVNATNLADNLEASGLTWKGYMESMPSPCYQTGSGDYVPRHNPMVYFDDIRGNPARCNAGVVPFGQLAHDLASAATTPNFAMIVPNLCNDMHDCSVSTSDTWLKGHLPAVLNSPACTSDTCLLILTWDEGSGQSNQVLTIFAGSGARSGEISSSVAYTHFSLLRTIEDIFGLPTLTSKDAAASPMTDLLK
jgi:phosphatidylinositol-3-phosphatase